jgi:hypothetical protein
LCRSGGIGRRAWFRSMYSQGCGGSSPLFGTRRSRFLRGASPQQHSREVSTESRLGGILLAVSSAGNDFASPAPSAQCIRILLRALDFAAILVQPFYCVLQYYGLFFDVHACSSGLSTTYSHRAFKASLRVRPHGSQNAIAYLSLYLIVLPRCHNLLLSCRRCSRPRRSI